MDMDVIILYVTALVTLAQTIVAALKQFRSTIGK